jgi:hypothetical protein
MRDRVDARVWVCIAISKRRCDSGKVIVYQVLVLHRGSRGSPGHGIEYPGEQAELSSSHGSSQLKDDGCEGHAESGEYLSMRSSGFSRDEQVNKLLVSV